MRCSVRMRRLTGYADHQGLNEVGADEYSEQPRCRRAAPRGRRVVLQSHRRLWGGLTCLIAWRLFAPSKTLRQFVNQTR